MPLPDGNMLYGFEPKLTDEQREYVDSIFDQQLTIVNAKAGTGKTTLAVACAALIGNPVLYTFSPVEEGSLGYTPGTVEEKEEKYLNPLKDALEDIKEDPRFAIKRSANPDFINKEAWIEAKSHTFVRGTNIKYTTAIIDEAANFTKGELKKILTRFHDTSTVILIGHDGQCDLKKPEKSGFVPYLEHYRGEPYCKIVNLSYNFRGRLAQKADELTW